MVRHCTEFGVAGQAPYHTERRALLLTLAGSLALAVSAGDAQAAPSISKVTATLPSSAMKIAGQQPAFHLTNYS